MDCLCRAGVILWERKKNWVDRKLNGSKFFYRPFKLYLTSTVEHFSKNFQALIVDGKGNEREYHVQWQEFFRGHVVGECETEWANLQWETGRLSVPCESLLYQDGVNISAMLLPLDSDFRQILAAISQANRTAHRAGKQAHCCHLHRHQPIRTH